MPRHEKRDCGWSQAWSFTWNNPPETAIETLKDLPHLYLIIGTETAPTTGTKHLQGYIQFPNQWSFEHVTSVNKAIHWERSRGSPAENRTYCSKESITLESGKLPKPGRRTDIDDVRDIIKNGGTMNDVVNTTTSYQAARFGELYLKYASPKKRTNPPTVKWIWGPTGTGKTKLAFEEAKDPWISNKSLQWWDGYFGQKDIIIDDFRGDFCTFHELLRILDRYPYRVMNKGGSCELLAENIWITSCFPPDKVYTNCSEKVDQLLRRITTVIQLKSPQPPDPLELLDEELCALLAGEQKPKIN